jgi:hypothetical protein
MNHHPQVGIEYLEEEIRVLKEQLGKRPRFNDHHRRRLALKGKPAGRKTCFMCCLGIGDAAKLHPRHCA